MPDTITLTGVVGTLPNHTQTAADLHVASFRLASTHRRFDRSTQQWVDGDTSWYTVTAFRSLAKHVAASIDKGQRVVVTGRVKMRNWQKDERSGVTIEVEADAIGHDLTWGTSVFTRDVVSSRRDDPESAAPESLPTEEPVVGADAWAPPPSVEVDVPF